jgi:hypothetical protein
MVLLARLWHGLVATVSFAIWTPFVLAFLLLTLGISFGAGLALFGLLREAVFGRPGLAPITEPWEVLLAAVICLLTSSLGVSLWIRQFEVDRIFRIVRGVFGSARLARRHGDPEPAAAAAPRSALAAHAHAGAPPAPG